MGQLKVGIVGAGVVGTTTALQVQQAFTQAQVTIIADKFNEQTTSDGAAGIFRPCSTFQAGHATRDIIKHSFSYYDELRGSELPQDCGVTQVSGYIFSSTSPSQVWNHLIDKVVPVYRKATEDELNICPGHKFGAYFSTLLIECRKYLPWALTRFKERGGQVEEMKINHLRDISKHKFDVVVNCLGLGARDLFQDLHLLPIRGQVLKVRAPWLKHFYYSDYDTYVIPGQELVTLGGCRNYNSYDLTASRHDTAAIWERCTQLVPSLRSCEVEKVWVGLRPHRHTVRIEKEVLCVQGETIKIVHNYGHGGYGVTTAPGSAVLAVQLIKQMLSAKCLL